ncbi:hypothetical protein GGR52DRAFT_560285 [Hypoxylon sp. FL1284]|nr:hypothetical protein GGR52DRAFT_560285 [Hypoxylon sp. FL1284]
MARHRTDITNAMIHAWSYRRHRDGTTYDLLPSTTSAGNMLDFLAIPILDGYTSPVPFFFLFFLFLFGKQKTSFSLHGVHVRSHDPGFTGWMPLPSPFPFFHWGFLVFLSTFFPSWFID